MSVKQLYPYLPETLLFLALSVCFFGELIATLQVNYLMIGGGLVLASLVIWKNKYLALVLSLLLAFISMFMLVAVLSEYRDVSAVNSRQGWPLLLTGLLLFGALLAIAFSLPWKYFKRC